MKFIIVHGSIVSGLGKGVTASSIGVLLQDIGVNVTAIKIDPYLNIDASLLAPAEHGETYVLSDGSETDLDFGSYERFLDIELTGDHSVTTGKVYAKVIESERNGEYLGQTVQVVPHVTDVIQNWLLRVARVPIRGSDIPDVCIIELGGTVGDIESMPFVEALRQLQSHPETESVCNVHVSLLPQVSGESKTKPAQQGCGMMRSVGLSPNILVCRHDASCQLPVATVTKLSNMCGINSKNVIDLGTEKVLWRVPDRLHQQNVTERIAEILNLNVEVSGEVLSEWRRHLLDVIDPDDITSPPLNVVLVGKYTRNTDAYLSVIRAIQHASMSLRKSVDIRLQDAESLETMAQEECITLFQDVNAIIIPGGFGHRGSRGIKMACQVARTSKIPFLGICLGFQLAVVEYANNVCGDDHATSAEFDEDGNHIVVNMAEYSAFITGASMRLGSHRTVFRSAGQVQKMYRGAQEISERHRHRYEVNPKSIAILQKYGLRFTGTDASGSRMHLFELATDRHPFYIGCQFHPEFSSRPLRPAPIFIALLEAAAQSRTIC